MNRTALALLLCAITAGLTGSLSYAAASAPPPTVPAVSPSPAPAGDTAGTPAATPPPPASAAAGAADAAPPPATTTAPSTMPPMPDPQEDTAGTLSWIVQQVEGHRYGLAGLALLLLIDWGILQLGKARSIGWIQGGLGHAILATLLSVLTVEVTALAMRGSPDWGAAGTIVFGAVLLYLQTRSAAHKATQAVAAAKAAA